MKRWRQRLRRAVQVSFLLLFVGAPLLNAAGVTWLFATGISLRVGPVELLEPASAVSAAVAARSLTRELLLSAAPVALLLTLMGSLFCGWACPWGLASELLDRLRFRGAQRRWPAASMRRARVVRMLALAAVFGGGAVCALPLAALFAGPRVGTSIAIELTALETLSATTALLMFGLLALELIGPRRLWCRSLCPVGGFASALRGPWTARVSVRDKAGCSCTGVPACQTLCPWGLDPRTAGWGDGCTTCMACADACPAHKLRIQWRSGSR